MTLLCEMSIALGITRGGTGCSRPIVSPPPFLEVLQLDFTLTTLRLVYHIHIDFSSLTVYTRPNSIYFAKNGTFFYLMCEGGGVNYYIDPVESLSNGNPSLFFLGG
jgi:hypothetical protein